METIQTPAVIEIPGFSDPVSSMTHLFGAPVFLFIGIMLIIRFRGAAYRTVSLSIFVIGVVFALSMSGVFHLLSPQTSGRYVLQVLDHAGIFFLIASTYTAVHILHFRGWLRWGFLFVIWSFAITGMTLESIFFSDMSEWLSLSLYLGLGWVGAISCYLVYKNTDFKTIRPLLYGAAAYTLGATMEFIRFPVLISGVIEPHELFHLMVLAGIGFHWYFVVLLARLEVQQSNN